LLVGRLPAATRASGFWSAESFSPSCPQSEPEAASLVSENSLAQRVSFATQGQAAPWLSSFKQEEPYVINLNNHRKNNIIKLLIASPYQQPW